MSGLVRVEGLADVERAFGEIPQAFRRQVMLRALRKGARPIVDEAKARAPRGRLAEPHKRGSKKDRRSGRSVAIGQGAESIKARPLKPRSQTVTALRIGPDSDHFYMSFAEFGTSRQRKHPFLRPAFDMLASNVILPMSEELVRSVEQTAARLARKAEAGTLSKAARKGLLT